MIFGIVFLGVIVSLMGIIWISDVIWMMMTGEDNK